MGFALLRINEHFNSEKYSSSHAAHQAFGEDFLYQLSGEEQTMIEYRSPARFDLEMMHIEDLDEP